MHVEAMVFLTSVGCHLTPRWSGRVIDKVTSSDIGVRAAQLNRQAALSVVASQMSTGDPALVSAVHAKDVERVRSLLEAGHGPDVVQPWGDSLLHHLVHEFQVTRSTQGRRVLEIVELLLKHGANPEQVGANNWRAIDLSIEAGLNEITEVFLRHGAKAAQREFT